MKKFLKITGSILLQFIIGVVIFLIAIRICSNPEIHYAGSANYNECLEKADTPSELEKEGGYNEQ